MRVVIKNRLCFLVQATLSEMKQVAADPADFNSRPTEQSLFTFAKCYFIGGGWWRVCGYAHDGSDVSRVLDVLDKIRSLKQVEVSHV